MTGYFDLSPLYMEELTNITRAAINFFALENSREIEYHFNIKPPFSINEFLNWYGKELNQDMHKKNWRIHDLIKNLESQGLFLPMGAKKDNSPLNCCYYVMKMLSSVERLGILWFGRYLGKGFISHHIPRNLVFITGKTKKGDPGVGSGVLLSNKLVLTCKHVVQDMTLDSHVKINGISYPINKEPKVHPSLDVGFIVLEENVGEGYYHKDVALRNAVLMEDIVIAGYPKIPSNLTPESPIFQSGEVIGESTSYFDKCKLLLISAISRPGNSGGPVLSLDGKVLGIVTQSLERQQEESDFGITSLPFFACLPTSEIIKAFNEMDLSTDYKLPIEDFQ